MLRSSNYILIALVAILAFMQLRSCNESKEPIQKEKIISSDTSSTLKLGKTDTVFFPVPGPIRYRDREPEKVSQSVDEKTGDSLTVFKTDFSDSLADILVTSRVKGVLISSDIDFKIKKPCFYLSRVDTLDTRIETVTERNRFELYFGGELGGSQNSFTCQPTLLLRTNKNLVFSVGYELIGKTYQVGGFVLIKNPFKR